ncbi:MAG: nitrogenase cofactor biosynthesis protein NifB [Sporomusaceae bacterium]|nr:nitrogenase cofactor biosynthesis protein NifB [Sporomusaceae bacterium]
MDLAALEAKTKKHPCYSFEAHQSFARMHLPVAPQCNISCNYCNRKFDCVNESRPGVTSEVLAPKQAKLKFDYVKEKIGQLSVVGIAGPGDALANWDKTKASIALIRAENPDMVFCMSTNGLMLPQYAAEIAALGVTHLTVTVNCLDSKIGAKIYKHVFYEGVKYEGEAGAAILLKNQLAGIEQAIRLGLVVKINIVMLPGINDRHIPDVVKQMKALGVFITNIMPLIPAPGSAFQDFPQTSMKDVQAMRDRCELDVQQMRHCKQCRADAIGLLGEDRSAEFRELFTESEATAVAAEAANQTDRSFKIAVTSKYGKLIDLHFGHATEFLIYEIDGRAAKLVERRALPKYCLGVTECDDAETKRDVIMEQLSDCDAVLTMRIGYQAQKRLAERGVTAIEYCYTLEEGLRYALEQLRLPQAV